VNFELTNNHPKRTWDRRDVQIEARVDGIFVGFSDHFYDRPEGSTSTLRSAAIPMTAAQRRELAFEIAPELKDMLQKIEGES
jgi:hypothetical protein